ncbi:hypothetical protein B0H19DRAFT_1077866 [Mycena capillaripes]|nr:hypothetical protein B0H19DRAFT_1077866 [Mycena capillaripes]
MRLSSSILFAIILALPTFTAPISNDHVGDEFALDVRAAKKVAAKKAPVAAKKAPVPAKKAPVPAKKVTAPAKKPAPVAAKKPAAVPPKKIPVPVKEPAVAPPKKAPVAAKKPAAVPAKKVAAPLKKPAAVPPKKAPVAAPKPAAVPAKKVAAPAKKPAAVPPKKASVATKKPAAAPVKKLPAQKSAPITSCPVPPRKPKTTVRRFMEYVGLLARTEPPACATPPVAPVTGPVVATPAPEESTVSPLVVNRDALPTGALNCRNRAGGFTSVAKEDIEFAIELARTVPVKTDTTFPHPFGNADGVRFKPADCSTKTLLEHAVGNNMRGAFVNEAGRFGETFGQFRVVITKPSPINGQTTFCGVENEAEMVVERKQATADPTGSLTMVHRHGFATASWHRHHFNGPLLEQDVCTTSDAIGLRADHLQHRTPGTF